MSKPFDRKQTIGRVIAICRKAVAPSGYEGTGRTWKLITDSFARLINLQTYSKDDLSHLSFTINIGVFFPELWMARNDRLHEPPLLASHCSPFERVGHLFFGRDKWWSVDRASDLSALQEELNDVLTTKVIPWLSQFESANDAFSYFSKEQKYFDAAVAAYATNREDVSDWVSKAIDSIGSGEPHDVAKRGIEIWARDHGVSASNLNRVLDPTPTATGETPPGKRRGL